MPDLDSYLVRHALTVARESGYAEVSLSVDGASFSAVLEPLKKPRRAASLPADGADAEPEVKFIKSTLVGYLQSLSLVPGEEVAKGTVVAVVTALGLANDIESPVSGGVLEVLAKVGDPVEYGQPLAKVMPS